MPKQQGLVLLWSLLLLQLMMGAFLMVREGSVLALQLLTLQQQQLETELRLENALVSLQQRLEQGDRRCEMGFSGDLVQLPCRDGVIEYGWATWGEDACAVLPGKPVGVRYLKVTVATASDAGGGLVVIQSSLAVPLEGQGKCVKIRVLIAARQAWRKVLLHSSKAR